MQNRIILGALFAVVAGVGVVLAQHTTPHQSPQHASRPDHAVCGNHHGTGTPVSQHHGSTASASSHASSFASILKLTAQQASDVDRITSEACAAMVKYQEQLLAVLTPEQRAKLQEMHGQGHADSPLATFFKRLHGG